MLGELFIFKQCIAMVSFVDVVVTVVKVCGPKRQGEKILPFLYWYRAASIFCSKKTAGESPNAQLPLMFPSLRNDSCLLVGLDFWKAESESYVCSIQKIGPFMD